MKSEKCCPFCAVGTVAKVKLKRLDRLTLECPKCREQFRRRRDGMMYCSSIAGQHSRAGIAALQAAIFGGDAA